VISTALSTRQNATRIISAGRLSLKVSRQRSSRGLENNAGRNEKRVENRPISKTLSEPPSALTSASAVENDAMPPSTQSTPSETGVRERSIYLPVAAGA
jgi:hypothetical protein